MFVAAHWRKWTRHLSVADPAHVFRAAELWTRFQAQRARQPAIAVLVEMASLDHYGELFTVDLNTAPTGLAVAS